MSGLGFGLTVSLLSVRFITYIRLDLTMSLLSVRFITYIRLDLTVSLLIVRYRVWFDGVTTQCQV